MTDKPKENDPFEGLVVGRVVHYYPYPNEEKWNRCPGPWAAFVTRTDESTPGVVTLNVQIPSPTGGVGADPVARIEKVAYSEEKKPGTWGWPKRGASDPPAALPTLKP